MKKRIFSILLAVALVATMLIGCGGNAGNSENSENKGTENVGAEEGTLGTESLEGKKVGFTLPSVGNDFMKYLSMAVKDALEAQGATCQIDSADGSIDTQIQHIENYATMGMDLIVVFPINGEGLTSVCQRVMEEGTPVFAFAMNIPDGCTTAMLSAEEADMGKACGDMANEWINKTYADAADGEVTVLFISGSDSPEADARSNAIREALKTNKKVTIVEQATEDWNSFDAGQTLTQNMFLSHPEIDVIVALNATTALGAEAFIASPDSPVTDLSKFGIFSVDETEEVVAKITDANSAYRGTISMGSIGDTVNDFMKASAPILTGGTPYKIWKGTAFVLTEETLANK